MDKTAYSEACERNKDPILAVLKEILRHRTFVLEIGSGTGQHAAYFAAHLPHLVWQPSDRAENMEKLVARVEQASLPNLRLPILLRVEDDPWLVNRPDAIFSANTAHIMASENVERMFKGAADVLQTGGLMVLYGPFNYDGAFTSESNRAFDASLRQRDPESGIRDFEAIARLASAYNFTLLKDYEMPANNRLIVWTLGEP
jgi:cyclopropane fatty-acyl-phospholipid synthase-like methyltransferase